MKIVLNKNKVSIKQCKKMINFINIFRGPNKSGNVKELSLLKDANKFNGLTMYKVVMTKISPIASVANEGKVLKFSSIKGVHNYLFKAFKPNKEAK